MADQQTVAVGGLTLFGETNSGGISTIPLPRYPGRGSFVVTAPFETEANAQSLNDGGVAGARSDLKRSGYWRFDALSPDLLGTFGSIQFKFKYAWNHSKVETNSSATPSTVINFNFGIQFRGLSIGYGSALSGDDFWNPAPVSFMFGSTQAVDWTLIDAAGVSRLGPGANDGHAVANGTAQLWEVEIFDSFGHKLTRFSDYEWYEVSAETTLTPVASGIMEKPLAAIESWRQEHFGFWENEANGADSFDFDMDGLDNLIEFAFGLDPKSGSSVQLPTWQKIGPDYFVSFIQPANVSGITYGAEWSTSLSPDSWTPITDTGSSGTHIFSVPTNGNTRIFTHLIVNSQ